MTEHPLDLEAAVESVRSGIRRACERSRRAPEDVLLVAATKSVPPDVIRQAIAAGLRDFGENRASELAAKAADIRARWHFFGALQTGTAPRVADHADVVHSGRPGRALERIARRALRNGKRISVLMQVDFTGERQGVAEQEVAAALEAADALEALDVVGLMTLPAWTGDAESTRPSFARLRALRDRLRERWPGLAELSMGMSGDYEVAIEEGATMVRIGTALFGPRPRPAAPSRAVGAG